MSAFDNDSDHTWPMAEAVETLKSSFDIIGDGVAVLNMQKARKSGYLAECAANAKGE